MTPRLELPAELTRQQTRQIEMPVQIAITHSAAIEDQALIQERALAFRRRLQLLQEVAQQLNVVGVDFGFFRDQLRVVAVMRCGMMLFRNPDVRVRSRTQLTGHDHGEDPRDIRVEGQSLQVEHQLGVLVKRVGNIGRTFRQLEVLNALRLGVLDALLDFANSIEIFVQFGSVALAKRPVAGRKSPTSQNRECSPFS